MKPVKAKTKTKKTGAKFGKVKFCTKETTNTINPDYTILRKPVDTSISDLYRVSKLLENGSDEIKAILAHECDIVYECRICRSLFRSLVNFISHKRVYCKEKFDITLHKSALHDYETMFDRETFMCLQETKEAVLDEESGNERILRSHVPREEGKKDLTAVIDMLTRKQNMNNLEVPETSKDSTKDDKTETAFELKESDQSTLYPDAINTETSFSNATNDTEFSELQNIINGNIDSEEHSVEISQMEKSDSPVQTYVSDEENGAATNIIAVNNLVCSMCNARFSTKKTLTCHMKTLHTSHRMCYPCPCCTSVFANAWSVYRHLFKVHRKTNEQVRKLRSQIQERAFRKETIAEESETNSLECNKSVLPVDVAKKNDTQEWIDHLESNELQRCGGCGKRFDRKAALTSHSQYCQRRIAACSNSNKVKKSNRTISEVLIDKSGADSEITAEIVSIMDVSNKKSENANVIARSVSSSPNSAEVNETTIRVQNVSSLSKEDWVAMENEQAMTDNVGEIDIVTISTNMIAACNEYDERPSSSSSNNSDLPEIIYAKLDNTEVVTLNNGSKKRKLTTARKIIINSTDNVSKSTQKSANNTNSLHDISTNSMNRKLLMEEKMSTMANLRKLQCLSCKRKFASITNLRRHIATHIGWNRYQCKLCTFKCFAKCDCVAHCNKEHNAQNNRMAIADIVIEIPQDQYTCNQNIFMDVTNLENTNDEELIEVNLPQNSNSNDTNPVEKTNLEEETDKNVNNNVIVYLPNDKEVDAKNMKNNKDEETTNNDIVHLTNDKEIDAKNMKNNKDQETTNNDIVHLPNDKEIDAKNMKNNTDEGTTKIAANSQKILDTDPDLRRMVMEVIFGSSDPNSSKRLEYGKIYSENDTTENMDIDNVEKQSDQNFDDCDIHDKRFKKNITIQGKIKPQRPIRNRVKPVNKDFIYDLKEIIHRKDSTIRSGYRGVYKSGYRKLTGRVQSKECNTEIQTEKSHVSLSFNKTDTLKHKIHFEMPSVTMKNAIIIPDTSDVLIPEGVAECLEK